jgi:hypothetical protein
LPAASEAIRLHSVSASLAPRARRLTDTADSARGKSRRSAIWPSTDQPPKPVSCASVKSISTFGGRGITVSIAHLRGDLMSNGNIADFTRSVRNFHDPAPNLSGNLGGDTETDLWTVTYVYSIVRPFRIGP